MTYFSGDEFAGEEITSGFGPEFEDDEPTLEDLLSEKADRDYDRQRDDVFDRDPRTGEYQ